MAHSLLLALAVAAAAVPAAAVVQSVCREEDVQYFVLGHGLMINEDWRVKTLCRVPGFSAPALAGLAQILGEQAINAATISCAEDIRSQRGIPVYVSGARRGWYKRVAPVASPQPEGWDAQELDLAATTLGVVFEEGSHAFAVMYPVTAIQLHAIDSTETSLGWLPLDRAIALADDGALGAGGAIPRCAMIRWYPLDPRDVELPAERAPILQTQVDEFVWGAIDFGEKHGVMAFGHMVLNTTFGWSSFWINDRAFPYGPDAAEHAVTACLLNVANATTVASAPAVSSDLQPLSLKIVQKCALPEEAAQQRAARRPRIARAMDLQRTAPLDAPVIEATMDEGLLQDKSQAVHQKFQAMWQQAGHPALAAVCLGGLAACLGAGARLRGQTYERLLLLG